MKQTLMGLTPRALARVLETVLVAGLVLAGLAVLSVVVGESGLGITTGSLADDEVMSVEIELADPVDHGAVLDWTDGEDGAVDAATGKPPVELSGPSTARLTFWAPTAWERALWVLSRIAPPAIGFAVIWLALALVRSVRDGDPFTGENERRLWWIAGIVAVGGTVTIQFGEFFRNWLVQRSAAADLASVTFSFSFLPIIGGLAIAVLATIWRLGIGLRDDVEGMV